MFLRQYEISFPVALDAPRKYPVSNAYGLTNVPTSFYIDRDQRIKIASVGWSKDDMVEIARRVSEEVRGDEIQVIRPGEEVPAYRAG